MLYHRIIQLGPKDDVTSTDHVLVMKLAPEHFEVSGTAGTGPNATYLPATKFTNQYDAFATAEEFAHERGIRSIYVKGFSPQAKGV